MNVNVVGLFFQIKTNVVCQSMREEIEGDDEAIVVEDDRIL